MKKLITLMMLLLFTIISYGQNNIIETYNIAKIGYIPNIDSNDDFEMIHSFGQVIVTKTNVQFNIENKVNMTLVIVSEIKEEVLDSKDTMSFTAILDGEEYVEVFISENRHIFIVDSQNTAMYIIIDY